MTIPIGCLINIFLPFLFLSLTYLLEKKNEGEAFVESKIITIGNKDNSKAYTRYETT